MKQYASETIITALIIRKNDGLNQLRALAMEIGGAQMLILV